MQRFTQGCIAELSVTCSFCNVRHHQQQWPGKVCRKLARTNSRLISAMHVHYIIRDFSSRVGKVLIAKHKIDHF